MAKLSRSFALLTFGVACAAAQAQITSFTDSSYGYGAQYIGSVGNVYSNSAFGPPTNYIDPYVANSVGSDFTASQGRYFSNVTVNTANFVQVDSNILMFAQVSASGPYYDSAYEVGYESFNCTLGSAGTITLDAYGTTNYGTGNHAEANYLYLDGTYYCTTAVDGHFVIPVSAGYHYGLMQGYGQAYAGQYGYTYPDGLSELSANYRLTISTVPEPCTMAFLGVAGLLALKRRRAQV